MTQAAAQPTDGAWRFWIDRGGTFTDVVALAPDGRLIARKLLSTGPEQYEDAALAGIDRIISECTPTGAQTAPIAEVRMGTTVGTNALLEHTGEPTALVITRGFEDALYIGYQNRPDIFALSIRRHRMLYVARLAVEERTTADGQILIPLNRAALSDGLRDLYESRGLRSCAIVFMHAHRYPEHELQAGDIARNAGFSQVSLSHEVSPLIKLVRRGDTTVVDAHLSPVLQQYVQRLNAGLQGRRAARLYFMQSHGGLCDAASFRGRDSLLSGPAGGVIGGVAIGRARGCDRIIGFDMGGTSTDVWHYAGELERDFESEIAGARMQTPVLRIHTVAAGGGSLLTCDGERLQVGPRSSGANPGPLSYGRGGPLSLTDANLLLGRLQPDFFPAVFGPTADRPLDRTAVARAFEGLADRLREDTGRHLTPPKLAAGFVRIAVEHMAAAIKKISVQRGYDPAEYTLCSFGGAGGQHACAIADLLGIRRVLLHPLAGVLSAYGMGMAQMRVIEERYVGETLRADSAEFARTLADIVAQLRDAAGRALARQTDSPPRFQVTLRLKYAGSDTLLPVPYTGTAALRAAFAADHRRLFGFVRPEITPLVLESLVVEASATPTLPPGMAEAAGLSDSRGFVPGSRASESEGFTSVGDNQIAAARPTTHVAVVWDTERLTPLYRRDDLWPGQELPGPALIHSATDTVCVDPGWTAHCGENAMLELLQTAGQRRDVARSQRQQTAGQSLAKAHQPRANAGPDPILLEIMNHSFRAIAEEMGVVLQMTGMSVNIKERLDFSCALFDSDGQLVANAPHIPVHLGSMSASVNAVRAAWDGRMQPGDAFLLNAPYGRSTAPDASGGTHLPDITVVTPVFDSTATRQTRGEIGPVLFYVASRGHHADVGGITPGSMPAHSKHIDEEGVFIEPMRLCRDGRLLEREVATLFSSGPHPARNIPQNLADLAAQVAANERGHALLLRLGEKYGVDRVREYMRHTQDNAARAVRRAIGRLRDGQATRRLDNGLQISVRVQIDRQAERLRVDFEGTSPADPDSNFNAPLAVVHAALMYVFRTLIDEDDIPLNAGCLRPIDIAVPPGCLLAPRYPRAVVAGNVETSQVLVDCLYAALGALAGSQGTMNNLSFGNQRAQYYETICGGSGAGPDFPGCDAVQTHMTNSRLTDPEVIEERFPVLVEEFSVRQGSGGAGRFSGGDGVNRQIRFREALSVSILANNRRAGPAGLAGGEPGLAGRNVLIRANGTHEELAGCVQIDAAAGDAIRIETPGGGGYGAAIKRV